MRALKKYKYLIFDVDDTLLSFYPAFTKAQEEIARKLGMDVTNEYRKLDEKCGWKAWKECGLENTDTRDVQENYHTYYYQYIKKHYLYLAQELGIEADAEELAACYIESISLSKELMELDTLKVYIELAKSYNLVLATNGMKKIQRPRISEFIPFTYKAFISEEVGYIKPTNAFFMSVIRDLGCEVSDCLMIGDSMTNDIIGAKVIGMDVCFYNPKRKARKEEIPVDYEIHGIAELMEILL